MAESDSPRGGRGWLGPINGRDEIRPGSTEYTPPALHDLRCTNTHGHKVVVANVDLIALVIAELSFVLIAMLSKRFAPGDALQTALAATAIGVLATQCRSIVLVAGSRMISNDSSRSGTP
jgi:hypothetical protein